MHSLLFFVKKIMYLLRCHGVDVSDDVTTTKAIRRVNEKIFKHFRFHEHMFKISMLS